MAELLAGKPLFGCCGKSDVVRLCQFDKESCSTSHGLFYDLAVNHEASQVRLPLAAHCQDGYSPSPDSILKPHQHSSREIVTPREEACFRVLRAVELNPDITQPQLAKQLGISMGKANYLIRALIDKGLIKIGNFQRRGDKLNKIAYLLTPEGLKNRMELTRTYIARKETEYEALKAELDSLRMAEREFPKGVQMVAEERNR